MKIIKKITSGRALYIVLACILSVVLWLYVASNENTDMEAELTGLEIDYIGGDDILQDRKLLVTEKDSRASASPFWASGTSSPPSGRRTSPSAWT